MWAYYKLVFKTAFEQSLGLIDLWSGLAAAALAIIAHYLPNGEQVVSAFAWQIPLWVLGCVTLVRLLIAPFLIWQADQRRLDAFRPARYGHAINIDRINLNTAPNGDVQLEIILVNTLADEPIQYGSVHITANGVSQNIAEGPWVLARGTSTYFRSGMIALGQPAAQFPKEVRLSLQYDFGPPRTPLRRRICTIHLVAHALNAPVHWVYQADQEVDL